MKLDKETIFKMMMKTFDKSISAAQDWHYYNLPTEKLTDFISRRGLTLESIDTVEGITAAVYFNDVKHRSCHTLTSGGNTGALLLKFA